LRIEALHEFTLGVESPRSAVLSGTGRTLLVLADHHEIHAFETGRGTPIRPPVRLDGPVGFLMVSPTDDIALAATIDGTVWRFPLSSESAPPVVLCRVPELEGAVFNGDGSRLATFSEARSARIWNVTSGKPLTPELPHKGAVNHAAFSPDDRWLATASTDAQARLWNVERGELVGDPLPHNARVDAVLFDASSRFLATTSADGAARVWRVGTHGGTRILIQHGANIGRVAFAPQPGRLLTVSRDGFVRLWDMESSLPLTEPFRHFAEVQEAGFHAGSRSVWTVTVDGTPRRWPVPAYDFAEAASLADAAELIGRMYLDPEGHFRLTPTSWWRERAPWATNATPR
jgi:WD40 repeat protein